MISFLDTLAQICKNYGITRIEIDRDNIVFSKDDGLNEISFMEYANNKFVGVSKAEFIKEYGGDNQCGLMANL